MSTFDALPATPEAFTTALRASAKLPEGEIVSVTVTEQQQTAISHLRFLEVAYSSASLRALPTRLLLKWPIQPSTEMGGDAETTFYRDLAPALFVAANRAVPRDCPGCGHRTVGAIGRPPANSRLSGVARSPG